MIDLATLIAHVESNDNQHAVRYEPHVHKRVLAGKWIDAVEQARRANACSRATAQVIVSCSWGAWQVMGFNLYGSLGTKIPIGEFLGYRGAQRLTFEEYCANNGLPHSADVAKEDAAWLRRFAVAYNGPGAPDEYVRRMRAVLAQLGG